MSGRHQVSGIQRPDQGRYREDESPGQGCLSRICSCLTSAINESCGAIPSRSRKRIAPRATHTSCTTAQRCQKTKLARSRRARRVQHLSRARLHHYSDLLLTHCPQMMAGSRGREGGSTSERTERGAAMAWLAGLFCTTSACARTTFPRCSTTCAMRACSSGTGARGTGRAGGTRCARRRMGCC